MTVLFSIIAALLFFMFSCGDQKPVDTERKPDNSLRQVSDLDQLGFARKPQISLFLR